MDKIRKVKVGEDIYHGNKDFLLGIPGITSIVIEEAENVEAWRSIRIQRDKLITETDWTQISDSQLSVDKKAEFLAYRKELRDIPQKYNDPDIVVWPVKPE